MFIIWGWGKKTIKKYGQDIEQYACGNCGNAIFYELFKVRTWFTLFFIPMIPYSTKYLYLCPICQKGYELQKEAFNEKLQNMQNKLSLDAPRKEIDSI